MKTVSSLSCRKARLQKNAGFTLVELLVVIAIVAILAAVVVLAINPLELLKRGRDGTRLSDLGVLVTAIGVTLQEGTATTGEILCAAPATAPCSGNSFPVDASTAKIDGSGWAKVNIGAQTTARIGALPIDPVNDSAHRYTYDADTTGYKITATLESTQQAPKMQNDGGSNNALYEVGTNLSL